MLWSYGSDRKKTRFSSWNWYFVWILITFSEWVCLNEIRLVCSCKSKAFHKDVLSKMHTISAEQCILTWKCFGHRNGYIWASLNAVVFICWTRKMLKPECMIAIHTHKGLMLNHSFNLSNKTWAMLLLFAPTKPTYTCKIQDA